MDHIDEMYMNKGCPCGVNTGGSNFYAFLGDRHFYCHACMKKLHDKFKEIMDQKDWDDAKRDMMAYLQPHDEILGA